MGARLTVQEVKALELLCEGLRNGQIGTRLRISENTVRNTLRNAYAKLGVHNRQDAVREFTQNWSKDGTKSVVAAGVPIASDLGVAEGQSAGLRKGTSPDPAGLYGFYRRLGHWRTPPRSAAFRTGAILVWFVIGCSILLIGLAVGTMLFGGTEGFAPAFNPS